MEEGPAKNLRQTPGRKANQSEKKWLLGSTSVTPRKQRKKKKRGSNSDKNEDKGTNCKQTVVSDFFLNQWKLDKRKEEGTGVGLKDRGNESDKDSIDYFNLPIQQQIRRLEAGYLTDPEVETHKNSGKKKPCT